MMNDTRVMSMEELQVFLRSSGSLKFNGYSRTETYAWMEKTLRQYKYLARSRVEKGLLRQYLCKMSGYSPAQLTRLIDQFHCTRHLRVRPYRRHCFPTRFTREDQFLLAEVDEAHERLLRPGHPGDPQAGIRAVCSPGVQTVKHDFSTPSVPPATEFIPSQPYTKRSSFTSWNRIATAIASANSILFWR